MSASPIETLGIVPLVAGAGRPRDPGRVSAPGLTSRYENYQSRAQGASNFHGRTAMKFRIALMGAVCAVALASGASAQEELRIGYLATMTGGAAIIGKHMVQGWQLGLEHEGWKKDGDKIAGVPLRMFYGDDQFKPDAGLTVVNKFISVDHVHMVAGMQWSN